MEPTKTEVVEGDTRIKDKLAKAKDARRTAPTKAEMAQIQKDNEKMAYEKNLVMELQIQKHKQKVLGNAKLNEDEYKRKKGRMKTINPTFEYETDEIQQIIDEAKLEQVYKDTKGYLAMELQKCDTTLSQIDAQQKRILERHPDFSELKVNEEELMDELDKAVQSFTPQ